MRLRIFAALPLVAALLAIAPAVSIDDSPKSGDSVSVDAGRKSGGKASGGFKK